MGKNQYEKSSKNPNRKPSNSKSPDIRIYRGEGSLVIGIPPQGKVPKLRATKPTAAPKNTPRSYCPMSISNALSKPTFLIAGR